MDGVRSSPRQDDLRVHLDQPAVGDHPWVQGEPAGERHQSLGLLGRIDPPVQPGPCRQGRVLWCLTRNQVECEEPMPPVDRTPAPNIHPAQTFFVLTWHGHWIHTDCWLINRQGD